MNISSGVIMSAQKIVIYGPEGIGKSTMASKFPSPVFCDTEGGTKRLNVSRFDRPTSMEMVIKQIEYVKQNPNVCKTFVLDTADWLEKLCGQSVCASAQKKGIEDFGYGKGYVYQSEAFGKILNLLEDLIDIHINVVVLAHATMRKFEQPDEMGAYDRWELKLDKRNAPLLKEWADAVFFVNYKTYVEKTDNNKYKATGGKRVMYTEHNPCWDAKNRYGLDREVPFEYSVISPFIPSDSTTTTVVSEPKSQQVVTSDPISELDDLVEDDVPTSPPVEQQSTNVPIPEGLPKKLVDLMKADNVSEEDIQLVVAQKGYFPQDTKIKDYGNEFIEGWLITFWDKVVELINQNNDLPFD